jgi:NADH dehydrogenase (ubiquinone) Fe-S protein 1
MLRAPLTRAIALANPGRSSTLLNHARSSSTPAKAPEKIEVFIDDQPVSVIPGTTVLQV